VNGTTVAATRPRLPRLDARLHGAPAATALPERVLQFGEGNFLRAFVDWMLHRMNTRGLFGGRAVLVQPIPQGMAAALNAQDGLYTVILRGLEAGQVRESREVVASVSRCLDPYRQYDAYLRCAENPDLRFVVSNTTEAGIRVDPDDLIEARPPRSFPGKLTQFLHARFQHFAGDPARGLVMLPCELIERNGDSLKEAVLETARRWRLPQAFTAWLNSACVFANTLVDRIVTGHPRDESAALCEALGYEDALMVAGETFHSWVIQAPPSLRQELPLTEAGLNVTWTDDVTPYRARKVRILNGAHTMTALAAYLAGKETVLDCMEDDVIRDFLQRGINEEVLPTLTLPPAELAAFAAAVSERFRNPFIKHHLLSIALNSVSKYRARILGTVVDYTRLRGALPPRLTFALAALIAFYRGDEIDEGALIGRRQGAPYRIQDDPPVLAFFRQVWAEGGDAGNAQVLLPLVRRVLANADLWGEDLTVALPGLDSAVAAHLAAIRTVGARAALERLAAG
jgi:tagaturonate reductase